MRGLSEIQKTNATPHADHGEESFGTKGVGGTDFDRRDPAALAALRALGNGGDEQRRVSDDISDALRRDRANTHFENLNRKHRLSGDEILEAILGGRPKARTDDQIAEDFLRQLSGQPTKREEKAAEALFALLLLDAFAHSAQAGKTDVAETGDETDAETNAETGDETNAETGDETGGIHAEGSGGGKLPPLKCALPPFELFWSQNQHLNCGQAKEAFSGGKTPIGAITFIGKEWDGIRAVPAKPVSYLGGVRPAYHGQFRVANPDGSHTWRRVVNQNADAISYQIPEAALTAARDCKNGEF